MRDPNDPNFQWNGPWLVGSFECHVCRGPNAILYPSCVDRVSCRYCGERNMPPENGISFARFEEAEAFALQWNREGGHI